MLALAACSGSGDAKRLDQISAQPGTIDTLKFSAPSVTNVYWRGDKIAEVLAALAATNRVNAHSWGKVEVLTQVAGIKDGRTIFSISLFDDGTFRFEDYYFKTKSPVPFPF